MKAPVQQEWTAGFIIEHFIVMIVTNMLELGFLYKKQNSKMGSKYMCATLARFQTLTWKLN